MTGRILGRSPRAAVTPACAPVHRGFRVARGPSSAIRNRTLPSPRLTALSDSPRQPASELSTTIWLRQCFSISRNEKGLLQRQGPLCSDCARAAGFGIDTSRRLFKDSCSYLPT